MSWKRAMLVMATLSLMCLAAATTASDATAQEIDRIGLEELKGRLGNPDLLIVDVRKSGDWENSNAKIKGAVREDPTRINEWYSKYPKDKTLVFYCA